MPDLVLKRAREILADPDNWTRGVFARTRAGKIIGPREANAACFCAAGAVKRAALELGVSQFSSIPTLMRHLPPGYRNLASFNDDPKTSHANILALFDKAIAS